MSTVIEDELYPESVKSTQVHGTVSPIFLQRQLNIGYNRAARLVEAMERNGVVSAPAYNGHRKILITE